MARNPGKVFEGQFQISGKKQGVFMVRFNDTDLSFNKAKKSRFVPKSPCDFFVYEKPYVYFLELKSTASTSISFETKKKETGMIKKHQIDTLEEFAQHDGSFAGFVFNFRKELEDEYSEETFYMSIENFLKFYNITARSSISKELIKEYGGINVTSIKKRKLYQYDVQELLQNISGGEELNEIGLQQDL